MKGKAERIQRAGNRPAFHFDPQSNLIFSIFSLLHRKNSRYSKLIERFDASRTDFTPYGFTCELWVPTPMPRPDRHNEVEMNFLPSGTLTYLLGGTRITVEAGRLT